MIRSPRVLFKQMYPSKIMRDKLRTQAYRLLEADMTPSQAIAAMVAAGVPLAGAKLAVAAANIPTNRAVLDICKRASMAMTAEKYGFAVEEGEL